MKKKLLAMVLALALLPVISLSAGALEPQDFAGGSLSGLAADKNALLVTDTFNKIIWRVENGTVTRWAGKPGVADLHGEPSGAYVDAKLDEARFMEPWAIAPYLDGYAVTDTAANVVRYVDGKTVRTAAGSGVKGQTNGSGAKVSFARPTGLAAGADGELYIADTDNGLIRRLDKQGKVTTWASGLEEPTGLCWANGVLYVAETGRSRICKIVNGTVTPLNVGSQRDSDGVYPGGYVDGPLEKAQFEHPQGVAVGADGAVYVADTGNGALRKIAGGRVTTLLSSSQSTNAVVSPRNLLVQGDRLLAADPFVRTLLSVSIRTAQYQDVPAGSWCYEAVMNATERGLTRGTTETTFSPNNTVTRAMFVTMLSRMHRNTDGSAVIDGKSTFTDVPADIWYGPAARWAADQGITQGSAGYFMGDSAISREALVTMLYRYAVATGMDVSKKADITTFQDAGQVSSYAVEAVRWAVANGVMSGTAQGKLAPQNPATRAQTVKLLVNFMDRAGI